MRIYLILILFVPIGKANGDDVIYVMKNFNTTIVVDSDIVYYNIGNTENIISNKFKNSISLATRYNDDKPFNIKETTILISYKNVNGELEHLSKKIVFTDVKEKFFYDYRISKELIKEKEEEIKNEEKKQLDSLDLIIKSVIKTSDEIFSYGVETNNIIVLPRVVRNDETRLYIKFEIINNTSLTYELDFISCHYVVVYETSIWFWKPDREERKRVIPYLFSESEEDLKIEPNKSKYIGVSLDLFKLKNDDYFIMNFEEKIGSRDVEFIINGGFLNESRQLNIE